MVRNKFEIKADRLHKQAGLLLKQTKLISQLRKFGRIEITGSYFMNLMSSNDIDVYVINPKMNKRMAIAALEKLILSNQFRGHLFYDFTVHKHVGFPKGWYVGLKKRIRGQKWKIDIWMIKKNVRPKLAIEMMTKTQRRRILAIKNKRDSLNLKIPAWHIYKVVLEQDPASGKILESAGLSISSEK